MRNKTISQISVDPAICHGKPVIKGTRVMVWQILELLEAGNSPKEIHAAFPTLPAGAVKTALHFAAEQTKGISYVSFIKESRQTQVFA